jgi:hypothetical protein
VVSFKPRALYPLKNSLHKIKQENGGKKKLSYEGTMY